MTLALFDLDNTLVDRTAAFAEAVPGLARRYDLDPVEAVPFIIRTDQDGTVGWPVWMGALIERFGIDTTVDEMRAAFVSGYLAAYRLDPGVADALRRLREAGWSTGIVTNGPPSQADKITGTGLAGLVDGWVVSEELGVRKPDPRIFAEAAARCGAELAGGWMVGDSAHADMAGARNAGLRSIWLPRGRPWPADAPGPDHQADGPVAAIELILAQA
ncbi:MAG TPA: HAD family hydrolase [Acidimicrobiales bacterium]